MLNPFEKLPSGIGVAVYGVALGAVSATMCALLLALLLQSGWAWRLAIDRPNARSLHDKVVPRSGGWGIVVTFFLVVGISCPSLWRLLLALLLLVGVSFLDDRDGLPVLIRFAAQFIALLIVLVGNTTGLSSGTVIVCALAWLWSTNLFNFMDGADGMAGAMTVIGFASFAAASGIFNVNLTTICVVAAGSAAGFLFHNRPPAKIFLGDVGSIPLGFLAAAAGYMGWRDGRWPFWFPFVVFSPFVADASVTLFKRIIRREKVWEAHREHYYQRLIQSGFSHAQTTCIWAAAMIAAGLLALVLLRSNLNWQRVGIGLWCGVLIALGIWIEFRWRHIGATRMVPGEIE